VWLDKLETATRARIQARVLRFEAGNLGNHRAVGAAVHESKLDFGPGYRIYFGFVGARLILLLLGGDKGTQERDIRLAQSYWKEYLEAVHGTKK
jgi:putative addiction module killer protein